MAASSGGAPLRRPAPEDEERKRAHTPEGQAASRPRLGPEAVAKSPEKAQRLQSVTVPAAGCQDWLLEVLGETGDFLDYDGRTSDEDFANEVTKTTTDENMVNEVFCEHSGQQLPHSPRQSLIVRKHRKRPSK